MCPVLGATQTEILVRRRLVPEHLILQFVGLRVVVNHETLKVLRTLVHDLAERIKIRKHPRVLIIEFATIVDNVLAQDKHIVNVGTQRRWNPHRVLHRDNEHRVDVPTIHKQISDIAIPDPRSIKQTVIQNQKVSGIHRRRSVITQILRDLLRNEFLALQHIGHDLRLVLFMNKHRRNNLTVELVGPLGAGYNGSTREILIVPQQILYQKGLASFAFSNQNHYLVVLDTTHIKLAEFQVESFRISRL